ncbi:hypothetical protein JIN76_31430 [Burkholderia sp. 500H]|nr:hypothetical protein [Burkholderia orbicola]MBK1824651.1 hypothetical protein [Burkholderia orbicola]
MYSYEERIRAVKLYLKLGKRLTATVRQLGYPTTKSLERWYQMYERCLDLPKGRMEVDFSWTLGLQFASMPPP